MGSRFIAIAAGCVLAVLAAAGAFYWRQAITTDPAAQIATTKPAATSPPAPAAARPSGPTPAAQAVAVGSPSASAPAAPSVAAVPPRAPTPVAPASEPGRPTFDVVRVEPTGDTLVAGRATPAAAVALLADGKIVATGTADGSGAFVLLPGVLAPGGHALTLQSTAAGGGTPAPSSQDVAVSVPEKAGGQVAVALQEPNKPTVLLADPTAAGEPPGNRPSFSFKTAEVQAGQGFYATGAAAPGARVRLYLNGSPLKDLTAEPDGHWSIAIGGGLKAGRYTLRGDALDAAGKVVARAEVPFTAPDDTPAPRPATAAPTPAATATVPAVQTAKVERGDNLWEISRKVLGDGNRYTRIYAANSSQIRDPNLIYPGQVFVLPARVD